MNRTPAGIAALGADTAMNWSIARRETFASERSGEHADGARFDQLPVGGRQGVPGGALKGVGPGRKARAEFAIAAAVPREGAGAHTMSPAQSRPCLQR